MIAFVDLVFGTVSEKVLPYPRSRFSPMLCSSQNFVSFIVQFYKFYNFAVCIQAHDPFRVNFCEGYKICVSINLFACGCPVVGAPFTEETIFTLLYCFAPLSKISQLYLWLSISGLFFYSINLFWLYFANTHTHTVLIIAALYLLFGNKKEHGKFVEDGLLHHFVHWKAFQAAGKAWIPEKLIRAEFRAQAIVLIPPT